MRASLSGDSNPALGVGIVKRDDFGGVRDAVGKNVLPVVADCFYGFQNRTLAIVLHDAEKHVSLHVINPIGNGGEKLCGRIFRVR